MWDCTYTSPNYAQLANPGGAPDWNFLLESDPITASLQVWTLLKAKLYNNLCYVLYIKDCCLFVCLCVCVLFVVQTAVCTTNSTHAISRHAATSPHNIQRRNFTERFNRSVTLARLCKMYKLPEDGRRPKHVEAIIMCILK